ncbi:MAG: hypothetical protein OXG42_08045 [Chloroflexi bacterium]|nr:hypothetical protein [Chloroflexota bacterium]
MHEILLQLAFEVTHHPVDPGTSSRPDFLVRSASSAFYLEATVCHSTSTSSNDNKILDTIFDWIDEEVESSQHWLSVTPVGVPDQQPRKKVVIERIRNILRRADSGEDLFDPEAGLISDGSSTFVDLDGYWLKIGLLPKPDNRLGNAGNRAIGAEIGGEVTDITQAVRDSIEKKAKQKHASRLDLPLVVACSVTDGFFDLEGDPLSPLFGSISAGYRRPQWSMEIDSPRLDQGVWMDLRGRPRNENVSGVWLFRNARPVGLTPTGIGECLFVNPFARCPLPAEVERLTTASVHRGHMEWRRGIDLNELLEVPHIPQDRLREIGPL